jgi:hypothetical protein
MQEIGLQIQTCQVQRLGKLEEKKILKRLNKKKRNEEQTDLFCTGILF